MGNKAPAWVTAISFGCSLIIWVLANGYPDREQVFGGLGAFNFFMGLSMVVAYVPWLWKRRNDVANVLMSVYGLGRLRTAPIRLVSPRAVWCLCK